MFEVLNSEERPAYWVMDQDPCAYDYRKMGVVYRRGARSTGGSRTQPLDWLAYDTERTENGMTNVGHSFGDHLTDVERFQVIEFLKILDTRRVRPVVIED